MELTYTDHADRALRAAALVLTMPAPTGVELDAARRLHDDLTTTLAEATRIVWTSALGEARTERERAGIPAARDLLTQLESYPRIALATAEPQSPTQRWSGRPTQLTADFTVEQAWKVLAAETFLARSCLDQLAPRLTTPIRASVLTQVALTADALATATSDLAVAAGGPAVDSVHGRARDLSRAAAVFQQQLADAGTAREGSGVPPVGAARERRQVLLVRDASEVAPALANLARLTATGKPAARELFAMTTMLGAMADGLVSAIDTATRSPRVRNADVLTPTVGTLGAYRGELAALVRAHQPTLASLGPGNPAALAQARELRTAGVPHIQALIQDPDRAASALRALQGAAARLAPATAAVHSAFAALDRRGEMLTYSWAPGPGFHWRAAAARDVRPLLDALGSATRTAAALRPRPPRRRRCRAGPCGGLGWSQVAGGRPSRGARTPPRRPGRARRTPARTGSPVRRHRLPVTEQRARPHGRAAHRTTVSSPHAGVGSDIPRRPDPGTLLASPPLDGDPQMDDLDALVDEILGSKPRPIDWTRLTGAAAEEARAVLDAWVRWLVTRYAIDAREIPACWAEHGDLFEELSALHTAHQAAYDPAGPPTGPADWHATLATTRTRLQLAVARTGCRSGQHREPRAPDWGHPRP